METKQCNKCGQVKPIDSFRKRKNRNGIDYWYEGKCKDCIHIEQKEYFKEKMSNPEYANKRRQDNKRAVIKYYSDDQNRIKRNNDTNIRNANKPKSCKIYIKECPITNELFVTHNANNIYSKDGSKIKWKEVAKLKYNSNKQEEWENRGFVRYKKCAICGKQYDSMNEGTKKHCSIECVRLGNKKLRRIYKQKRRRNIQVWEGIDPYDVFKRDKWRCQMCGIKTPKKLRGTFAPNAPELDHIMPLSKGGSNTSSNTQCLCRRCNSIKSNKLIGQLKLCI